MRARAVLHARLAARLCEHADAADALGATSAGAMLRWHANAVANDPAALKRVARELAETAARFGGDLRYPVARVWSAAADEASHPMRLRRPPVRPLGLAALSADRRHAIQEAGRRAHAALPSALLRESARKGAATRKARGIQPRGERHPACKLSDAQVVEIRRRWAQIPRPSQRELAEAYGVTRELINKILRGKLRADARVRLDD